MIPNIVKGMGISGAIRYNLGEGVDKETGLHKELEPGAVSRSEILGGQNFGFVIDSVERVDLARRMMEFNALPANQKSKTRLVEKDCLHLTLAWDPIENPSREEMQTAARSALKALGMERALAVFFAHTDTDHPHLHIVASRLDPTTGRAFPSLHDHTKLHAWALQWEREHGFIPEKRRALHALVNAVRDRNLPSVLEQLTARHSTFTRKEVERAIGYSGLEGKPVKELADKWLSDRQVIALREHLDEAIKCYTTRDILAAERQVQRDARDLAAQDWHGTPRLTQLQCGEELHLSVEQMNALHRMTGNEGFAMVAGQAGTGKSRTMQAARDVYEAEGFRVVGLAQNNSVVNGLRDDGFVHAATVSHELGLNTDRETAPAMTWDAKTVVMVDETAMMPTRDLAALTERAREASAKLILVGDDHQLASVDRGGMFLPLRNEHGAAELNEVRRPHNEAERGTVWNQMHKGDYQPALEHFDKQGSLHWHKTEHQAELALAKEYAADVRDDPGKSRFIIAHSNASVDRLNALGQQLAREQGRLGPAHTVQTAHGERVFAAGDRIQFTGNGRSIAERREGMVNGALGTVAGIETQPGGSFMAVALDNGRKLRFEIGPEKGQFDQFKLGYAGTIYKAQSKSIDQVYPLVSKGWTRETAYVAMTRHRESVSVHVPHDVAKDIPQLAHFMGRDDDAKRAASGYILDPASLVRSGLVLDERARPPRATLSSLSHGIAGPAAAQPDERGGASDGMRGLPAAFQPQAPTKPIIRGRMFEARSEPIAARGGKAVTAGLFMAADSVGKGVERLADFVAGLMESLGGTTPQQHEPAALARDPAARRNYYAQQAAERSSDEALDRLRLDMEAGKGLSRGDVQSLTHAHLLQIKAHGDDYLRQIIAEREERERSGGRERER